MEQVNPFRFDLGGQSSAVGTDLSASTFLGDQPLAIFFDQFKCFFAVGHQAARFVMLPEHGSGFGVRCLNIKFRDINGNVAF